MGRICGFTYSQNGGNAIYYKYIRNAQGDVTHIVNQYNTVIAAYTYDTWGKLVSIKDGNGTDITNNTSSIGYINPIRYRGYYYDNESGFYYLQSRYYDPMMGRFINADSHLNIGDGPLGCNLLVYCGNDPVNDAVSMSDYNTITAKQSVRAANNNVSIIIKSIQSSRSGFQDLNNRIDITEKLNAFMREVAEELLGYSETHSELMTLKYFVTGVLSSDKWDIKNNAEWKFEKGKHYYFNGEELRNDDPGNIAFGYYGAVLFPIDILHLGAGGHQVFSHVIRGNNVIGKLDTLFDDERDYMMIEWGYKLYWKEH